jgi:MYXO-CTERM domain-containing protein
VVSGEHGRAIAPGATLGFATLLVASIGVAACSNAGGTGAEPLARNRAAVESSGLGVFYGMAFEPAPSLSQVSSEHPALSDADKLAVFARELAVQAAPYWSSGVITIPALSPSGAAIFAPAPATNRIRYSCGVTLVAPSYAVTAGHCVDVDSDVTQIELRLYRATSKLAETYTPAPLSGTFPSYTQPQLTQADGYLFDEYPCVIVNRCYANNPIDCPDPNKDSALLRCSGRPGDKYGFVNVSAGGNPTGKEALMHWKHEVLDLGASESSLPRDRIDHYVMLGAEPAQNYHYFDAAADLLPVRSLSWGSGNPTRWVSSTFADTHGCHGSSGSGLLARLGETSVYELVGPAVHGGMMLAGRLCERVPNPGGSASGEGTAALGVDGFDPRALLALNAADVLADCRARVTPARDVADLPFSPGSHAVATLYSHLDCQVDGFGRDGTVSADPRFGPYPEKFVELVSGTEYAVGGFSLDAASDYRLGAQVMPRAACAADCGSLTFAAAAQSFALVPDPDEPGEVAAPFATTAAGPANLALTSSGQLRAVGGITLIREGQVNSFDTLEERLEAALYALDDDGNPRAGPLPMRFAGDGSAGFQARLLPGERLALLRQALVPGRSWTVRVGSSSYEDLTCGLLDRSGAPLAATACAELVRLDDRGGSQARFGFYVELRGGSSRTAAEIRYVALASDAARDDDQDGVPEVLDNCPNDWNGAQGACDEEPPLDGGGGAAGEGGGGGEAAVSEAGAGGEAGEPGAAAGEGGAAGEPVGASGESGLAGGTSGSGPSGGSAGAAAAGTGGSSNGAGAAGGASSVGGSAGNESSGGAASGAPGSSDGSARKRRDDSGCGCRVAGEPGKSSAPVGFLLLGAALLSRRRARAARAPG